MIRKDDMWWWYDKAMEPAVMVIMVVMIMMSLYWSFGYNGVGNDAIVGFVRKIQRRRC